MTAIDVAKDLEASNTHSSELRQRKQSKPYEYPAISSRPFAGRIGGNQEFVVSPDDASLASIPDAAAIFSWHESFHTSAFADVELWKESSIEAIGTCLQTYLSGLASVGLGPLAEATSLGSVAPAAFGSLATGTLVTLFIFSTSNVSDGHVNPFITMATFTARLSVFPRTVLYIVFQSMGGVVAGLLIRASLDLTPSEFQPLPGCCEYIYMYEGYL